MVYYEYPGGKPDDTRTIMNKLVINEGFAKWPIGTLFGGDDETNKETKTGEKANSSANSNSGNSGANSSSQQSNSSSNSSTDNDDEEDEDEDDTPYGSMSAKELRRELERKDSSLKKNTNDLTAAQQALQEKERAEMDEIDGLKVDLKNVTEERDELAKSFESSSLLNAVILNKDYEFHDPTDVVFFIKRNELTIDTKTGEVEGLAKELKRVAADKPHLVLKSKAKNKENNGNNNNGNSNGNQQTNQSHGSSGFQPGQGGGANNANKEERGGLLKKYSSLANR